MSFLANRLKYTIEGEKHRNNDVNIAPQVPNLLLNKNGSPTSMVPKMAYKIRAVKSLSPISVNIMEVNSICKGPCSMGLCTNPNPSCNCQE